MGHGLPGRDHTPPSGGVWSQGVKERHVLQNSVARWNEVKRKPNLKIRLRSQNKMPNPFRDTRRALMVAVTLYELEHHDPNPENQSSQPESVVTSDIPSRTIKKFE